ncbi:prevent-host-death family protein [Picosynechococcus sp. PCC 7003]|uniref:type II toxin-antitoxin system Phd/YefM family antitoxin n=1 Tax=Picosynechococcus sp. PCC 7003 TaxID=374981 RepID=UPI0008104F9C|nr:type II toxin-antitoxin system Phd/YefM family antitoxin [Picosynechococcus sp. PCC 7003]ANV85066.1 prevent-host-death family protein [Picosynechococcus sp. PCC 7003]
MSQATTPQHSVDEPLKDLQTWKLEDAKARFSEVVRLAQKTHPQMVTVRGKEAVVVMSAEQYAKLLPLLEQPNLHELLAQSPLSHLDFEPSSTRSPVREVEL